MGDLGFCPNYIMGIIVKDLPLEISDTLGSLKCHLRLLQNTAAKRVLRYISIRNPCFCVGMVLGII